MPRKKNTRNPLGSIFPRQIVKHGRKITVYDVRKRFRDDNGKYHDRTKRCYSHGEALAALQNLPQVIDNESKERRDRGLFALTAYFRKEYVKPVVISDGKKVAGYRQNLKTVKRYLEEIEAWFGDVPVDSITYEQCRAFRDHLATTLTKYKKLPAASTYHKKLTILSRLFVVAMQLGWIVSNPMTRGKSLIRSGDETTRNRMLTYDEEERLLAQCTGHRERLRILIYAALDTGMRRGEIFDLRWWQIDFDNKVIYLTKSAAERTKTGVAGILPLSDRLAAAFQQIHRLTPAGNPNDLVIGYMDFRRAWTSALDKADITDLQFRDLRSTAATRMLLAGNVGELVRKITRHTRPETLLDHYTNIDMASAQAVGQKLEKFNKKQGHQGEVKGKAKKKAPGK